MPDFQKGRSIFDDCSYPGGCAMSLKSIVGNTCTVCAAVAILALLLLMVVWVVIIASIQ
jgi:hypothetical protein